MMSLLAGRKSVVVMWELLRFKTCNVGLLPAVPVCRNRMDCPRVSGDDMTDGLARMEIPAKASEALGPLDSPNPSYG